MGSRLLCQQDCGGRGGNGEQPVVGAHPTRSDGDRVRGDLLDPQRVQPGAGADDVDDRVDRADLMEMHVLDRLAVGLRLGRGEGGKDGERRVADGRRQGRSSSKSTNGPPVARWLLVGSLDDHSRAANRAAAGWLRRDTDALDPKPRDGVPDRSQGNAGIDQGAKDHVSAGARKRIEDGDARQEKTLLRVNAAGALPGPRVKHSLGETAFRPC